MFLLIDFFHFLNLMFFHEFLVVWSHLLNVVFKVIFVLDLFMKIVLEDALLYLLDLLLFHSLLKIATLLLVFSLLFIIATWTHKITMRSGCQVVLGLFKLFETAWLLVLMIVESGSSTVKAKNYSLRFWNYRLTRLLPTDLLSWLWERSFLLECDCLTSLNSRLRSLVMSLSSLDWLCLSIWKSLYQ